MVCHQCGTIIDSRYIYRCENISCQKRICQKCLKLLKIAFNHNSKRISSLNCPHCNGKCECNHHKIRKVESHETSKNPIQIIDQKEQKEYHNKLQKQSIKNDLHPMEINQNIFSDNKCLICNGYNIKSLRKCSVCNFQYCATCVGNYNLPLLQNYNSEDINWKCPRCLPGLFSVDGLQDSNGMKLKYPHTNPFFNSNNYNLIYNNFFLNSSNLCFPVINQLSQMYGENVRTNQTINPQTNLQMLNSQNPNLFIHNNPSNQNFPSNFMFSSQQRFLNPLLYSNLTQFKNI